jgi:hypothetical protein
MSDTTDNLLLRGFDETCVEKIPKGAICGVSFPSGGSTNECVALLCEVMESCFGERSVICEIIQDQELSPLILQAAIGLPKAKESIENLQRNLRRENGILP